MYPTLTLRSTTSLQPLQFTGIFDSKNQFSYKNRFDQFTISVGANSPANYTINSNTNSFITNKIGGPNYFLKAYDASLEGTQIPHYSYPDKSGTITAGASDMYQFPSAGIQRMDQSKLETQNINLSFDYQRNPRAGGHKFAIEGQISYNFGNRSMSGNYALDNKVDIDPKYQVINERGIRGETMPLQKFYSDDEWFKHQKKSFSEQSVSFSTPKLNIYAGYREEVKITDNLRSFAAIGGTVNIFDDKKLAFVASARAGLSAKLGNFGEVFSGVFINTRERYNTGVSFDNQLNNFAAVHDETAKQFSKNITPLTQQYMSQAAEVFKGQSPGVYTSGLGWQNFNVTVMEENIKKFNSKEPLSLDKGLYFGYGKEFKVAEHGTIGIKAWAVLQSPRDVHATYASLGKSLSKDPLSYEPEEGRVTTNLTFKNVDIDQVRPSGGFSIYYNIGGNENKSNKNPCKF